MYPFTFLTISDNSSFGYCDANPCIDHNNYNNYSNGNDNDDDRNDMLLSCFEVPDSNASCQERSELRGCIALESLQLGQCCDFGGF